MTEQLPFHFSLSCIGERDGNPLQCSCLENPRDGGSWWASVSGVEPSWTPLKRLSSSSSRSNWPEEQKSICGSFPKSQVWGLSFSLPCVLKLLQSCPTLCDPMDSSPPGLATHSSILAWSISWAEEPSSSSVVVKSCPTLVTP